MARVGAAVLSPKIPSSDISSQSGTGAIDVWLRHWFFDTELEVVPQKWSDVTGGFLVFAQVMVCCLIQLIQVKKFRERHGA